MFRVLFCLNCCTVPAKAARPIRKRSNPDCESQSILPEPNFKNLKVYGTNPREDSLRSSVNDITVQNLDLDETLVAPDAAATASSLEVGSRKPDDTQTTLPNLEPLIDLDEQDNKQKANSKRPLLGLRVPELGGRTSMQEGNLDSTASSNIPSTTRIGDYARIEYSPVEESGSVSTLSKQTGSEKGINVSQTSLTNAQFQELNQGVESCSISIASQLSSELEKNITNILETANSPVAAYGTIGLPLGPPIETSSQPETTKTSPDTNGPALTSASQDSLSPFEGPSRPNSQAIDINAAKVPIAESSGGVLVADSVEESNDLIVSARNSSALSEGSRIGSVMANSLTNPTPTPSELSTTSSKKRRKLTAKGLLKKLKPKKSGSSRDINK